MPSLIRKEKVSCEHCGTQVTRNNIVRHKIDAQLEPCIAPNVPTFQHCPRMI